MGFAAATIGGWILFGARYWLGYVTVGLELLTIAIVAAGLHRADGGPAEIVQRSVPALAPGTYTFRCDVHPDMTGTLAVR